MSTGIIAIAAALAIAISTIGPAIGQGLTAAHAMDAIARQPEVAGTIRSNMIIAMGLQMLIKAPIMAVWAVIKILGKSWELSAVTAAFVVVLCTTVLVIMSSCLPGSGWCRR